MITEIKKELNKNPLNAEQIKSQLKILEGMHSRRVKNVEDYKNDLKRLKEIEGK
jgi:dTDP-4-amino-4,6-dideoxygalactose transaminase